MVRRDLDKEFEVDLVGETSEIPTHLSDQASLFDRVNPELVSRLYILENVSYEFVKVRN
jgi:hypothetical protein